jgi:glutathione S-transferase
VIKVYHVPWSRSVRVLWLLEELGDAYEVETIGYPPDEAFRKATGLPSVPAIVDDGIVMGESIAILQYLTGRRLQRSLELGLTVGPSPDPAAYAEHLQFLHLGEASLMTPLSLYARTSRMAPEDEPNYTAQECARRVRTRVQVVEDHLADGRPYLTGPVFTIADISVGYALAFARFRELDRLIPPATTKYLDRVQARPAFQRAVAAA